MKKSLITLSLLMVGLGSAAEAQVAGCIVTPGNDCRVVLPPDNGGYRPDPNPYDPVRPGPGPGRPGPVRPGPRPPYPAPPVEQYIQRTIVLNRYVRNERMDLNMLLGYQANDFEGAILDSVVVNAQEGDNGRGSLDLLVDGLREDTQWYVGGATTLRATHQVRMGRFGQRIEVQANAKLFISSITVNARRGGGYNPPPPPPPYGWDVRQPIYQNIFGYSRLPLDRMINLGQYRGYRLLEVIIHARSYGAQYGNATLLVNGFNQGGATVDSWNREYRIQIRGANIIGQGVDSMILDVSNISIDDVVLKLAR